MELGPAGEGPEAALEGNSGTVREGGWWRWDFLLCLTVALIAAFLVPLDDTDLPMHLRTGAWILDRGKLPVTEPFAWTRAGAPFFAYSWLPEVSYELAWRAAGATGLSVLHALLLGGVVIALWDLARVAGWSLWATRLTCSVHLILWLLVQPATRPQLLLAIAMPMAWAGAYRLRRASAAKASTGALLQLFAANVLAVNSHLFFFLMPASVVVLLAMAPVPWRRVGMFAAATVGAWVLSPNAVNLAGILSLNFGANALLGSASPIMELESGFALLLHATLGTRLLIGGLLLLPLLPFFSHRAPRERWWYGLAWLAGLGLYGIAMRGMLLWWLLALPLVAWALASIPLPTMASTKRAVVFCWSLSIIGLLGQAQKAHARAAQRTPLAHDWAMALEPAVRWLHCAIPAGGVAPVRGTTAFDYGSYLTWRVPQLSWSIDGRAIFPDSVARADARQELRYGIPVSPPWRSSDVVLLVATHASLLDVARDSAWQHVLLAVPDSATAVSLWVRRDIAARGGRCTAR